MRVPVAVTLESRDGTVSKDAKVLNGVVEPRGDQPVLRKRPGTSDLGQIWKVGSAQLLYSWNGLWAIYGDYLTYGTSGTIVNPSFATWNSSDKGSAVTLSNGNLTAAFTATTNVMVRATLGKSVGKFYWEVRIGTGTAIVGIATSTATLNNYLGQDANGYSYAAATGNKVNNASATAYGATLTAGDIVGVAFDADNGTLTFYKNGVSQGQAFSGLSGTFYPAASGNTANADSVTVNFGATAFTYSPPTGFTAGIASLGTSLGPTTGGLKFDAQEVGASASTQLMMIKNRTQAWTVTRTGAKTAVSFASNMGSTTYSVTGLTRSGTTATATFASAPDIAVGDSVTIAGASPSAYNGAVTVTAVTAAISTPGNTVYFSITRSGTTATATSSSPHGLTSGTYTISGANESAYNGSFAITVTSATTFTYTVTVTPATTVTWNASDKSSQITLSGGNLTASGTAPTLQTIGVRATLGRSSGKYYFEFTTTQFDAHASLTLGAVLSSWGLGSANGYGDTSGSTSLATGVVFGVAVDITNTTLSVYKNNVLVGSTAFLSSGTLYPAFFVTSLSSSATPTVAGTVNFGATAFTYTPPSGYSAWQSDDPVSPATGNPSITTGGSSTPASISYTVSGSPTTPATGTITATTNGGTVPGIPYIDGYFFVMDVNGVMWHSSSDDPATWGALNFLNAQNENGKGKALGKSLNYLIAFKEWSTEFFYDAKNPVGFAFSPVDNGFTRVGCASGDSVAEIDGNLVWVSQVKERGRSVHVMTGLQQQRVSTPDVDRILNNDDLATVYTYGVKIGGHSLYILTLVTSNITLVYDLATQTWTQWSSLTAGNAASVTSITRSGTIATVTATNTLNDGDPVNIAGANQGEYNGIFQAFNVSASSFQIEVANTAVTPATGTITFTPYTSSYFKFTKSCDYLGSSLFLHESNGHLYQMLPSLNQDAGLPIDLFFRTTRLDGGSSEVKVMSRATVIGDHIADTMMLRWSDDDCNTFSSYRSVDLSLERPSLRRCGKFRRRTIEGRYTGNSNPRIEALELEVPQ